MVVSKEISDCFTKLVEPLVTTERLEKMFGKLKEGIIERSEESKSSQHRIKKSRIWRRKSLFKRKRSKM